MDIGEAYYPSTIGKYVIYEADSTVYDEFTFAAKLYKYQIKEKIEESYTDIQGRPALKLVRYIKKFDSIKPYSAIPWTLKDVWQVNISKTNVEVVEENIRFIKLIFPVKDKISWDGNSTNTLGQWNYIYSYTGNPENVNGINFELVTQVTQKDFPTLISREHYVEKYAKDVGLVYRKIVNLKLPVVTSLSVAPENIPQKSGIIYTLKVISHGTE